MDDVARLSASDRYELILAATQELGLSGAVIEKDFWVCWILKRIFSLPGFEKEFVFKGGTSLSKVYGAIDRFSEDVDLVWDRQFLGFGSNLDIYEASQNRADKHLLPELDESFRTALRERLLPSLNRSVSEQLGADRSRIYLDDSQTKPSVRFDYPQVRGISTSKYLTPHILLEFVPRADPVPNAESVISPYLSRGPLAAAFVDPSVSVVHLTADRTFWEKVTILHHYHYYPESKPFGERFSRHYYDTWSLYSRGHVNPRRDDLGLLHSVIRHKRRFYAAAWANYPDAGKGGLRLLPSTPQRMERLREDYTAMYEMFFGEVPEFEQIIATLAELEREVNRLTLESDSESSA